MTAVRNIDGTTLVAGESYVLPVLSVINLLLGSVATHGLLLLLSVCHKCQLCWNCWINPDIISDVVLWGSIEPCISWGLWLPHGRGHFWVWYLVVLSLNVARSVSGALWPLAVSQWYRVVLVCFSECPNYDLLVPLLLTEKVEDLPSKCKLTPGECWWTTALRPEKRPPFYFFK